MTDSDDMDSVLAEMSNKLEVGCESGVAADHSHYAQYKNYGAGEKRQKERRDEWLTRQKEGRADIFNKRRSNLTQQEDQELNGATSSQDKIEEIGEVNSVEMQDDADASPKKPGSWKKHMKMERVRSQRADLKDRLMYGEWLIDLPDDFAKDWRMVPVPKGKRCMVVFDQNSCKMFNKFGLQIHNLTITANISPSIICDGLVSGTNVYILDFIEIKPYDIESCDFDCRRFLGNNFLNENGILKATDKYRKWSFHMLESTPDCSRETIQKYASERATFEQDGLMFYHKEGYYTPGVTPLANWLKPWMLAGQEGCLLSVMDGTSSEINIKLPKPDF